MKPQPYPKVSPTLSSSGFSPASRARRIQRNPGKKSSWLTQRSQVRAQWLAQERIRRQELYKEFIEHASKCYVDALQRNKANIPALVDLYAKIDRMRVLSSSKVCESAEQCARKIVHSYSDPDKTSIELREMVHNLSIDLLRDFSEACRAEFES
jgi:hypothetical protein